MASAQDDDKGDKQASTRDTVALENGDNASNNKKKRTAERQITKDDDDEEATTTTTNAGTFERASAEVLKQRRMVKAKRPDVDSSTMSKNPFQKLASQNKSVFGSGVTFDGKSGSSGFGFGNTTSSNSGFGSGSVFGSTAATTSSTVFGAKSTPSSGGFGASTGGFGSTSSSAGFGTTTTAATEQPPTNAAFATIVPVNTGEEDEDCVLQVRVKSFVLVDRDKEEKEETKDVKTAAPSVPPSSSKPQIASKDSGEKEEEKTKTAEGNNSKTAQEDASKIDASKKADKETSKEASSKDSTEASKDTGKDDNDDIKEASTEASKEASEDTGRDNNDDSKEASTEANKEASTEADKEANKEDSKDAPSKDASKDDKDDGKNKTADNKSEKKWREIGIGPLRILVKDNSYRFVQRRENTPGGAGTKLLLNLSLEIGGVSSAGEKFVQLTTVQPSDKAVVTYLFRCKTVAEAISLKQALEKATSVHKSGDTEK